MHPSPRRASRPSLRLPGAPQALVQHPLRGGLRKSAPSPSPAHGGLPPQAPGTRTRQGRPPGHGFSVPRSLMPASALNIWQEDFFKAVWAVGESGRVPGACSSDVRGMGEPAGAGVDPGDEASREVTALRPHLAPQSPP